MNSSRAWTARQGGTPDVDLALPRPSNGDPSAPSDREARRALRPVLVGLLGRSAVGAAADRDPDGAARANRRRMAELPGVPLVHSPDHPADDDPVDGRLSAGATDLEPLDHP